MSPSCVWSRTRGVWTPLGAFSRALQLPDSTTTRSAAIFLLSLSDSLRMTSPQPGTPDRIQARLLLYTSNYTTWTKVLGHTLIIWTRPLLITSEGTGLKMREFESHSGNLSIYIIYTRETSCSQVPTPVHTL